MGGDDVLEPQSSETQAEDGVLRGSTSYPLVVTDHGQTMTKWVGAKSNTMGQLKQNKTKSHDVIQVRMDLAEIQIRDCFVVKSEVAGVTSPTYEFLLPTQGNSINKSR
jgi:hypothetical protein